MRTVGRDAGSRTRVALLMQVSGDGRRRDVQQCQITVADFLGHLVQQARPKESIALESPSLSSNIPETRRARPENGFVSMPRIDLRFHPEKRYPARCKGYT